MRHWRSRLVRTGGGQLHHEERSPIPVQGQLLDGRLDRIRQVRELHLDLLGLVWFRQLRELRPELGIVAPRRLVRGLLDRALLVRTLADSGVAFFRETGR